MADKDLTTKMYIVAQMLTELAKEDGIISIGTNSSQGGIWRGEVDVNMSNKRFFKDFAEKGYEFIRDDRGEPFLMLSHLDGIIDYHTVITNSRLDGDGELVE